MSGFVCVCVCLLFVYEMGSCYILQSSFELVDPPAPSYQMLLDYKYVPPLVYIATVLKSDLWVHLDLQLVLLIKSISPVFPSIHYSKPAIHS